MIAGFGGLTPGLALLALAVLIVWIVVMVWIGGRVQAFLHRHTGWSALDWRSLLGATLLLTGAIHFGSFALDLFDRWSRHGHYKLSLEFPGVFLIGSVAIGVGIAAVKSRRK